MNRQQAQPVLRCLLCNVLSCPLSMFSSPCPLAEQGKVPIQRLQQQAASLLSRVDSVQQGLRSLLSGAIQQRLAAAHWPPPLAVSGEGGAAAAGAPENGAAFKSFAAAGEVVAAELQQLLVLLLTLQRASQHQQFSELSEASQEGPLLWAAEELAAPLAQRLRHHFAGGLLEHSCWAVSGVQAQAHQGSACRCCRAALACRAWLMHAPWSFPIIGTTRGRAAHRPARPAWVVICIHSLLTTSHASACVIHPQAGCPLTGPTGQSGCLQRPSRQPSSVPRWRRSCSPALVRAAVCDLHCGGCCTACLAVEMQPVLWMPCLQQRGISINQPAEVTTLSLHACRCAPAAGLVRHALGGREGGAGSGCEHPCS